MHDLPQELVDKIIDHLYDDTTALQMCSRVCWAWVPATRFHIFANITLRRKWHRLVHPQFRPFLDMLDSGSCTFTLFVARLTLEQLDATPEAAAEFAPAFSALAKMSSVSSLTLLRWQNLRAQPLHELLPQLPALSELSLRNVAFDSAADLFHILDLCTTLAALTVAFATFRPRSQPIIYSHGASIQKLHLIHCPMNEILDVLAGVSLNCRAVELLEVRPEFAPSIGKFLAPLGDRLQHLTMEFSSLVLSTWATLDDGLLFEEGDNDFCANVDLRAHTRLTTFRINQIAYDPFTRGPTRALTMLPKILRGLVSPHLTDISLSFSFYSVDDLDVIPWGDVDRIPASDTLESLQRVDLCIEYLNSGYGEAFVKELAAGIVKRLPRASPVCRVMCGGRVVQ